MLRVQVLALSVLARAAGQATAQPIPRTPEGRPDFHGTWSADFLPNSLERLQGATALVVDEAEATRLADSWWAVRFKNQPVYDPNENLGLARRLPRTNGEWRTSQITDPSDGKAPITGEGARLIAARRERMDARPDGPEARGLIERCIGGLAGAPLVVTPTDNLRQFFQTKDHLVIFNETDVGEVRIIGIEAKARPPNTSQHLGDSVASWERDTLVIETTNRRVAPLDAPRGVGMVVRSEAKVIERLTYISDAELLYRFTIIDADIYDKPWSAEYSMMRSSAQVFETACHEGNYAMINMLAAGRESERKSTGMVDAER
jgi:hypothetical protein